MARSKIGAVLSRVKSRSKGRKADSIRKKLVANRKSRENAEAERLSKQKTIRKRTGQQVKLPKTFAEDRLQDKRVKIKTKARKLLRSK